MAGAGRVEFRFQRGSTERWDALDPVLGAGEPGVEVDTGLFKIGNGHSPWSELEYFFTESYVTGLIEVLLAETGGLASDPRVGDMADLTTASIETLVAAINEVNAKTAQITTIAADLASLEIDVASVPFYIPFGRPGILIPFVGPKLYFTDDVEFADATFSLTTAPTGSSAIFEILKNGSSVYSSNPAIAASGFVSSAGTLAGTTIFAGRSDYLQVRCLQAGLTVPGSDLSVLLKMIPA